MWPNSLERVKAKSHSFFIIIIATLSECVVSLKKWCSRVIFDAMIGHYYSWSLILFYIVGCLYSGWLLFTLMSYGP
jgi:hypothetical protein